MSSNQLGVGSCSAAALDYAIDCSDRFFGLWGLLFFEGGSVKVNWIKCSERLPIYNENELKDYWCFFGKSNRKFIRVQSFPGRFIHPSITHWAEIEYPEPPEEDKIMRSQFNYE